MCVCACVCMLGGWWSEPAARPRCSCWRHHQIKQQLWCVSALCPRYGTTSPLETRSRFTPAIDKSLHWGIFIIECMTWFCSSLGWRPISLTTVRQILFDKVYVRACASNPPGDIVLARCRLYWDAGRHDDSKVKWKTMLAAPALLLRLVPRFTDRFKWHKQMTHTCVIYDNSTYSCCFCYN